MYDEYGLMDFNDGSVVEERDWLVDSRDNEDAFSCVGVAADNAYHEAMDEELIVMSAAEREFLTLPEDVTFLDIPDNPQLVILEVLS